MSLNLHWFLPLHGDGTELAAPSSGPAAPGARRDPDLGYLIQVALAAERFGFTGMLTPFGMFCEDPWVLASALAMVAHRIRFMVALRPGLCSPVLTAQAAASFQRISGGRLQFNIVTGGDPDEQRRYGDHLDYAARYARTAEFLEVFHRAWSGEKFDFTGDHYDITGGLLARPHPMPPQIFLGGSSEHARRIAARHADVLLSWGEAPDAVRHTVLQARQEAELTGRRLEVGIRFHVISRDTAAEAWSVAHRLVETMDPARIRQAQQRFRVSDSEGQRRMAALHGGRTDTLEIHPNVWAGYGLVRPGVATALVGSHEDVADRIEEYHSIGIDHLILSAQPHLEEAYAFGEGVMPRLRKRGIVVPPAAADDR